MISEFEARHSLRAIESMDARPMFKVRCLLRLSRRVLLAARKVSDCAWLLMREGRTEEGTRMSGASRRLARLSEDLRSRARAYLRPDSSAGLSFGYGQQPSPTAQWPFSSHGA